MSGVELPAGTIQQSRTVGRHLAYRQGGQPFSIRNRYPVTGLARIHPQFRLAFLRRTGGVLHTVFDVWVCAARDGLTGISERAAASEPRERSAPTKRRARERACRGVRGRALG